MPMHQRNQRVNVDHFSMVPRADIPRSTFRTEHTHKTTFDGGWLIPIHCEEILPGDSIRGDFTIFARMATLLFPIMDHICIESFAFFMPARLTWANWRKFMGERTNPNDSISFTIPQVILDTGGMPACSLFDYFGIPGLGQVDPAATPTINALPFRAYNAIWNAWFRDENLQDSQAQPAGDGPDLNNNYLLKRRNKRHDYFTSALPWPLKNNQQVNLPLGGLAPIKGIGVNAGLAPHAGPAGSILETDGSSNTYPNFYRTEDVSAVLINALGGSAAGSRPGVYADLSQASGAAVSALRLAVQTQRFLERDARSGTRYTELLRAHFGVTPEDARLQRPEYIGGGKTDVDTQAIPQTSATDPTQTPLGALAGQATAAGQHHFSYNASEHGYLIILLHADAELTYQQGLHKMWSRLSRFDFYWPVFAHLSEQPVSLKEIFFTGNPGPADDDLTFGYQERWAEYRHRPSRISGMFRSTTALAIDQWHSAQVFNPAPTLNTSFIQSDPPFPRNLAAGISATNLTFIADILFRISSTRAMPMYSVPGGMDRF